MMFSLEGYKCLKGEINRILTEGEDLLEEDEYLIKLISSSMNSKDVLDVVKQLKEEGNLLFKQRKIDDALEKYGYAGLILARYEFLEEKDMIECFELDICVLLNSAACFNRKNEFELVGRICTIVLGFNPNSVKALFRRAMAAMELGKREWAFWDLLKAAQIEPGNKEVSKKLGEIQNLEYEKKSNMNFENDISKVLGSGVSSANERLMECMQNKGSFERDTNKGHDSSRRLIDNKEAQDVPNTEANGSHNCLSDTEGNNLSDKGIERMDVVVSIPSFEISNKVEPQKISAKYSYKAEYVTYAQRHRPSQLLNISKQDMKRLQQGKELHYYHPHLRFMSVRISGSKNNIKMNGLHKPSLRESITDVVNQPGIQQDDVQMQTDAVHEIAQEKVDHETQSGAGIMSSGQLSTPVPMGTAKRKTAREARMRALWIARSHTRKNVLRGRSRKATYPGKSRARCFQYVDSKIRLPNIGCKRKEVESIGLDVTPSPFKKRTISVESCNICLSESTHGMTCRHSTASMG